MIDDRGIEAVTIEVIKQIIYALKDSNPDLMNRDIKFEESLPARYRAKDDYNPIWINTRDRQYNYIHVALAVFEAGRTHWITRPKLRSILLDWMGPCDDECQCEGAYGGCCSLFERTLFYIEFLPPTRRVPFEWLLEKYEKSKMLK